MKEQQQQQDATKLEFLMKVNDNIIVQRFFNVRGFNPDTKNSIDLYEYIREFSDIIQDEMKIKTCDYMLANINEIIANPDVMDTSITDGPEYISIYLKQNDMTICHRVFDAKIYPPKIRYTVDVRPHIKNLLTTLTDIFSTKNLTFDYNGVSLNA
jgi:hypothetical protein